MNTAGFFRRRWALLWLMLAAFQSPQAKAEEVCEGEQVTSVLVAAESTRPWNAAVNRLLPQVFFKGQAFEYVPGHHRLVKWWHRIRLPGGGVAALPAWESLLTCAPEWALTRNFPGTPAELAQGRTGVITAAAVTVRSEPTNDKLAWFDKTRLGELYRGTVVRVLGRTKNGWLKIRPYSLTEAAPWFVQAHDVYPLADPGPAVLSAVTPLQEVGGAPSVLLTASRPLPVFISVNGNRVTLRILVDQVTDETRAAVTAMGGWVKTGAVALPLTWKGPVWGYDAGWMYDQTGATFWLVGNPRPEKPAGGWRSSLEGLKVVVDPGHGAGFDLPGWKEGGRSKHGGVWYREEKIVLDIALQARDALERRGATVYMTRQGPEPAMMSLPNRPAYAKQVDADLFLSIHSNAGPPGAHGLEVYFFHPFSEALAKTMLHTLGAWQRNAPRKAVYASFAVLRPPWMPGILIETAYHSNRFEAAMLVNPEFHKRSGEGIAEGVVNFMEAAYQGVGD